MKPRPNHNIELAIDFVNIGDSTPTRSKSANNALNSIKVQRRKETPHTTARHSSSTTAGSQKEERLCFRYDINSTIQTRYLCTRTPRQPLAEHATSVFPVRYLIRQYANPQKQTTSSTCRMISLRQETGALPPRLRPHLPAAPESSDRREKTRTTRLTSVGRGGVQRQRDTRTQKIRNLAKDRDASEP